MLSYNDNLFYYKASLNDENNPLYFFKKILRKVKKRRLYYILVIVFFSNNHLLAQNLYVKNSTNNFYVDITSIVKFGTSCVGNLNCSMIDIFGIAPGGSASQTYPISCTSVPEIKFIFQLDPPNGPLITVSYCGTPLFNQSIVGYPEIYDILLSGSGTDILFYIHY